MNASLCSLLLAIPVLLTVGCAGPPGDVVSQCRAGDSRACLEAGKFYTSKYRATTGVEPSIELLTEGAKFNTPEADTKPALDCVYELISAYDFMAYGLADDHRMAEAQAYIQKGKALWVYLYNHHYTGSLWALDLAGLKAALEDEDDAFASAVQGSRNLEAIDRAGNAAMLQAAASGWAAGFHPVAAASIPPPRPSTTTGTPSTNSVPPASHPSGPGCPGQTCHLGCSAQYDGKPGARPAITCDSRNCGMRGSCNLAQ